MEVKRFGPDGPLLPIIGQGTWDIPEHGARLDEARHALRRGIELGMTHIDTAEMYGSGRAEEIVGEVISGCQRDTLFLTTKVLPSNASFKGTIAACERSLRRLKTEYLDLFLLHWRSSYPIEETMAGLEQLVTDGKVRALGVSNFDVEDLREAQSALRTHRIACNQVLYHLSERGIEAHLLPFCKTQGIPIVGYTPFGRSRHPGEHMRPGAPIFAIAQKYGKSPHQVILRFLTRDSNVFTIPKASRVSHVEENAGGCGWELEQTDVMAIDALFPVRANGPLATL
ncbi:MAG: aldo/keto reductase [Candidatus Eremiobacteraeota bacterium]|nr:aldo/keto reductase [Candidatus Eremiobacteraeota bacterium]